MSDPKTENRKAKNGKNPGALESIRDFTDLVAWQLGRELRKRVYEITRRFPPDEKHVLVAQLRRAAISVTANVAEGYGRFSYLENIQFCRHARGSAYEVRDHLTTALDAGHLPRTDWDEAEALAKRVIQVLNGYIRSTRERQGKARQA